MYYHWGWTSIYDQMTNDRPVNNLPLVNYNINWPIIGHLYCITSFFIGLYTLFQFILNFRTMLPVRVFPGCLGPTPRWPAWLTPSSWTRRVTWTSTMSPRATLPCTWRQWRRWGWRQQLLIHSSPQSGIAGI